MSLPEEVQTWINDFCNGKTTVRVPHMMFSEEENINTITLEKVLYLIRRNAIVKAYVADDTKRQKEVAKYVADVISRRIISTFKNAEYPGD